MEVFMFKIKENKFLLSILNFVFVSLVIQSLTVSIYAGGNELPENVAYNNNLFSSGYEYEYDSENVNLSPEDDEENLEQRLYNPKEKNDIQKRIRDNRLKKQKNFAKSKH